MSKTNWKGELLPLKPDHLHTIRDIAAQSFVPLWEPKEFYYFLTQSEVWNYGFFVGQECIAYLLALKLPGEEFDIVSIATRKDYLRQGVATQLVGALQRENRVNRVLLEVRKDNTAAIGFYQKLGFRIYHTRKGYYQGKCDAICMEWVPTPVRIL